MFQFSIVNRQFSVNSVSLWLSLLCLSHYALSVRIRIIRVIRVLLITFVLYYECIYSGTASSSRCLLKLTGSLACGPLTVPRSLLFS